MADTTPPLPPPEPWGFWGFGADAPPLDAVQHDRCPEFGFGLLGRTLTCDLRFKHDGDHHDAETDARWFPLDSAPSEESSRG